MSESDELLDVQVDPASSSHLVWAEQFDVTSCVADPRCIQDFQTPYVEDPWEESRYEGNLTEHSVMVEPGLVEEIPLHERGSIPLSRLITTTWVSLSETIRTSFCGRLMRFDLPES